MSFMFVVFIAIVAMFYYSLQDNQIEINDNLVRIKGDYGIDIRTNEIKSIELVNELPEISIKTNGFALQTIRKGNFKTKNGENVNLFINSVEQPIIYITTNTNQKIYYSSKEKSKNLRPTNKCNKKIKLLLRRFYKS
ncbi:PH domain-containing protein [Flavobacterium indicum]|uniref:PH domain-containing protein n=1 Tax=Flavobacterium indicum TaxID=312277 RepID=UPI0002FC7DBE|nr:PH domain-containing protein [Flavobacterium indicum]